MTDVLCLNNFPSFKCKCGACRNTCCKLWHITLSEDEYFKISSLECSDKLKDKLKYALYPLPHPTEDKYADFNLTYEGNCPLLDEKGFCSLQCECGETVLPSICNNYPRSNRFIEKQEISLSTSCEGVMESLLNSNKMFFESYSFDDNYFSFNVNENNIPEVMIREKSISFIQDSNYSFKDRFNNLRTYFESILQKEIIDLNDQVKGNLVSFLNTIIKDLFDKDMYIADLESLYISNSEENFKSSCNNLTNLYPEILQYIENILVNHMFYMNYPFYNNQREYETSYISLYTNYYLLLSIFLKYYDRSIKNTLVDYLSFSFKIIEHTNFYHNARVILNRIIKGLQ